MKTCNVAQLSNMLRDRFDYQQLYSHSQHVQHIHPTVPCHPAFSLYQFDAQVPAIPSVSNPEYQQPLTGLFSPPMPQCLSLDELGLAFPTPTYLLSPSTSQPVISTPPPPDFSVPLMPTASSLLFNNGIPYLQSNEILPPLIPSPAISAGMDRFSVSPRTTPEELFQLLWTNIDQWKLDTDTKSNDPTWTDTLFNMSEEALYENQPTKRRRIELMADKSIAARIPESPAAASYAQSHKIAQSDKYVSRSSKNRPRNTRSIAQKTKFYKWIIDHIDHPFPTDKDRQHLCIDAFDKKDFYWWFSNHRHRNLICTVDDQGKKQYRPKLTFYKTCQRLGLDIPWAIPEEIKRHLKRTNV